jgi:hypothetical protein
VLEDFDVEGALAVVELADTAEADRDRLIERVPDLELELVDGVVSRRPVAQRGMRRQTASLLGIVDSAEAVNQRPNGARDARDEDATAVRRRRHEYFAKKDSRSLKSR